MNGMCDAMRCDAMEGKKERKRWGERRKGFILFVCSVRAEQLLARSLEINSGELAHGGQTDGVGKSLQELRLRD